MFGLFKSQRFHDSELRRKHRRSISPEFQRTFALEVLKTERLRVIALIVVATAVVVLHRGGHSGGRWARHRRSFGARGVGSD